MSNDKKRLKLILHYKRNTPRCGTCANRGFVNGKIWCNLIDDGVKSNSLCDAHTVKVHR